MHTALFVYPERTTEVGNMSGRPPLFELLMDRNIMPVASRGAETAFQGQEVVIHSLNVRTDILAPLGRLPLEGIDVAVNRIGRSIKEDRLPDADSLPPIVNENELRSLAFRKYLTDSKVLAPVLGSSGMRMPTVLAVEQETVEAFLEQEPDEWFIVKPDSGTSNQGIRKLERDNVAQLFVDNPDLYGKQVIQPAYDFTEAMPTSLRPYDQQSAEAFEGWRSAEVAKEVRVYGFHSPAGTEVFPVGRAITDQDNWFFIDPESLPYKVMEGARLSIARAAEVTGAWAVYGTVDFGYGARQDEPADWQAIEMNARFPYMIGYDKHAEIAHTVRGMFADQLQAVAQYQPLSAQQVNK